MTVKLAKRLYFKPHQCPDCGKRLYFTEHAGAIHCRAHSRAHDRSREHYLNFWVHKKFACKFGHCALCGTKTNLTVHHVGGGYRYYTTLCEGCHANYETYANVLCHDLLPLFRSILNHDDPQI